MQNNNKSWVFNFSASPEGGGLKRFLEISKWFEENTEGALFLVHPIAYKKINSSHYKNKYEIITQNKIDRLFFDGSYLSFISKKYGKPDIYFSYGIPSLNPIGLHVNWLHISNALTVVHGSFQLEFKRKIELYLLRKRFLKTPNFYDIISAESQFCLDEFNKNLNFNIEKKLYLLKNGADDNFLQISSKNVLQKNSKVFDEVSAKFMACHNKYAVTIGTWAYKRVDIVYKVFTQLQKQNPDLKKLVIIGNPSFLSKNIKKLSHIELLGSVDRDHLYNLLQKSEYFISASEIENSPNSVLEALFLCKKLILSNIPAHLELVNEMGYKLSNFENMCFLSLEGKIATHNFITWSQICENMYLKGLNSIKENKL